MSEGTALRVGDTVYLRAEVTDVLLNIAEVLIEGFANTIDVGVQWVITEAGALAPAGLTAGQVDAVRAAVALGEAIRLHGVCGLTEASMVITRGLTPGRIATLRALATPAADAATGEPS